MPMDKHNTRLFHRALYGKILETVTVLKRDDDFSASTITAYVLYECRWSRIFKKGQPIQGDMFSDHKRTLHVPRNQMMRVGIDHFNALDQFVDEKGRFWQPESPTLLTIKMMENHYCIDCLRVDPPGTVEGPVT